MFVKFCKMPNKTKWEIERYIYIIEIGKEWTDTTRKRHRRIKKKKKKNEATEIMRNTCCWIMNSIGATWEMKNRKIDVFLLFSFQRYEYMPTNGITNTINRKITTINQQKCKHRIRNDILWTERIYTNNKNGSRTKCENPSLVNILCSRCSLFCSVLLCSTYDIFNLYQLFIYSSIQCWDYCTQ